MECVLEQEMRPDVNAIFSVSSEVKCGFSLKFHKKYLERGNITVFFLPRRPMQCSKLNHIFATV